MTHYEAEKSFMSIDWKALGESEGPPRQGVGRRYDIAKKIVSYVPDPAVIGEALSFLDHEFHFPWLTYFRFPNSDLYSSLDTFLEFLKVRDIWHSGKFRYCFNGFTEPRGRACELESVRVFEEDSVVSFLFSCTRVLVVPDGQPGSFEYLFLTRIPVVVRFLFEHELVEMAMPTFSEPLRVSDFDNAVPGRYQAISSSVRSQLVNLLPDGLGPVNFAKFTLYLEVCLDAVDMGWRIEPQDEASFDLRQRLVPLKRILDSFSESLNRELKRRNLDSPILDMDLYKVFRSLKERSYTYHLVLEVPIGRRGGKYLISTLYGPPNSGSDPFLWIPGNGAPVISLIHDAISESQTARINNPYNIDLLFANRS